MCLLIITHIEVQFEPGLYKGLCYSLQLNVAQSELDIYLSNQHKETNKLKDLQRKLEKAETTLKDRKK